MLVALFRAAHAQPTLAVTAIAGALAVSAGRGLWGTVAVVLAVLPGQLSVGWSNDYLDRGRDAAAGRGDKPIVAGELRARLVGTAAVAALGACVVLSLLSGWRAALVHLAAVSIAWAYNLFLKRTSLSVAAYAVAFGLLPAFVTLGLPSHPLPPAWASVAGALLGAGAHFVNTLADFAADHATGVRGLPHRLGRTVSLVLGAGAMTSAASVLALAPRGAPSVVVLLLFVASIAAIATVLGVAASGHDRTAWSATLCSALLAVALFIAQGRSLA